MKDTEFVSVIREEVLEHLCESYKEYLLKSPLSEHKGKRTQKLLRTVREMSPEQQAVLLRLIRRGMVDTISSIFGILDGTTLLRNHRERFLLTIGSSHVKLSGDLQDYFLAAEEEKNDNEEKSRS